MDLLSAAIEWVRSTCPPDRAYHVPPATEVHYEEVDPALLKALGW